MSRSALRVVFGIVLALVLVAAVAGGILWWKLSTLKEQLLADLGKAIGAQVQVASIDVDLWKGELHAAGITLTNQRPSAPWEKGDISQAVVHYHLGDVFQATLPITVEVSSWNVTLHSPLRTAETPPAPETPSSASDSSSGPGKVRVTRLSAEGGTVEFDFSDDRKATIRGVSFEAMDNGGGIWTSAVKATSMTFENLEVQASSVELRSEPGKITFSDLRMQIGGGAVTGDGEIALDGSHAAKVNLKEVDVPTEMMVGVAWRMKLHGLATGDVAYTGDDQGGSAKGQISVNHGKFDVLPWLGKLTAMVGLPDISNVEVDKATTDFEWKNGTMHLTNLDIRKNDVSRIAGEVDVDPTGNVDGHLKLGLPSTITAKWPQLQAQVFPVALEDFNWADVHVTGTPDHLQEDLTPRVMAAGLGSGSDLLNQGLQKAGSLLQNILGK